MPAWRRLPSFDKAPRRIVEVPLEYRGFEVGDEFLLGYGLDWEGKYRNLTFGMGGSRSGDAAVRPRRRSGSRCSEPTVIIWAHERPKRS